MGWFSSLNSSLSSSFAKVREDTSLIFRWITWLKARGDSQQNKLSQLDDAKARLESSIAVLQHNNALLKSNHNHMMDYMRLVHKEVVGLHSELHEKPVEAPAASEHILPPISSEGLTEAENVFLSHLYHAPKPLSYGEISKSLNLNYGTIKNRLNRVRAKGIDIRFLVDETGERRFYLPDTVKIRLSGR